MKKIFLLFLYAFVFNVLWENAHSFLYSNYKGGAITEFILVRASLFDAFVITLMALPFVYIHTLQRRSWLIVVIGTLIAIGNEWYGLHTYRWMYNAFMPIIPIIQTGITPTLQLGILGYLSYTYAQHSNSHIIKKEHIHHNS